MNASDLAKVTTKTTVGMSHHDAEAGIQQMLWDLERLAKDDGCIAAGWALEFFNELTGFSNGRGSITSF